MRENTVRMPAPLEYLDDASKRRFIEGVFSGPGATEDVAAEKRKALMQIEIDRLLAENAALRVLVEGGPSTQWKRKEFRPRTLTELRVKLRRDGHLPVRAYTVAFR